ncbi:XdhC family protein [Thermoproteus sp. CP80]|uniref:XdhC family protein n=1 Tax=Thermoproteus sp. CP80 TaxID=1650659 RepID=UPI001EDCFC8B|nr:XdhC family protein [Thermoproteus sp. CP80]
MSVCDMFKVLDLAARRGEAAVVVRVLDGGRAYVDAVVGGRPLLGLVPDAVVRAVAGLRPGERAQLEVGGMSISAEAVLVRPTVIVVGFGEVARRVSEVAAAAGYYVAAIGHEAEGAFYRGDLPDLERLVSEGSIVVVANEGGHPSDVDVVELAVRRGAGYVALLASQRRAALVVRELERRGLPREAVASRLRSPAGLDIGARTAGEIAVSVVAEVVMYLRGGSGRPMREIKDPYKVVEEVEGDLSSYRCEWRPQPSA